MWCDAGFVKEVNTPTDAPTVHIQSLRARSVCVDSPVCPMSCVCFVIIVLTVFLWQCAYDDSQTHKALGGCFKNTNCSTHTHNTNIHTHTLVLPLSGHTLVVTHTLCNLTHHTDRHTCAHNLLHTSYQLLLSLYPRVSHHIRPEFRTKNKKCRSGGSLWKWSAHRITNSTFTTTTFILGNTMIFKVVSDENLFFFSDYNLSLKVILIHFILFF